MTRALISCSDLVALGGPVPGDPPGRDCDCEDCPHYKTLANGDLECDQFDSKSDSGWLPCPLVLPESGPLVLRVLWRHLVTKDQANAPLGPMEVPEWKRWWIGSDEEWAISHKWDHRAYTNHGDLTDPCEALATVVKDETETSRRNGR